MDKILEKSNDMCIWRISSHKELSYGEKIAKMGPVYPEIFDKIRQFFGRVVPDIHKWFGSLPSSPSPTERTSSHPRIIIDADCTNSYVLNSGVTEPNLSKFL